MQIPLNIIPSQSRVQDVPDGGSLRVEAAWDSSLHDSLFLNRMTPANEYVSITVTCNVDVGRCARPMVVNKELRLRIHSRDASLAPSRSIVDWFTSRAKSTRTAYKATAIYELTLRNEHEARARAAADAAAASYVRGEELLKGWRPRGASLLGEQQVTSRRLEAIADVERSRQLLRARPLEEENQREAPDEARAKEIVERTARLLFGRRDAEAPSAAANGESGQTGALGDAGEKKEQFVPDIREVVE